MKLLSYADYSDFYANKCPTCLGQKRVKIKDIWTACICQHSASLKFKFEQFEVDPPDLKYRGWSDFDGFFRDRNGRKTQSISPDSLVNAKKKAFSYCFDTQDISLAISDRYKHLVVHKHRYDGQNLIIVGESNSGRTLLAALVVKEVAYACRIHALDLTFRCVKSYDLLNAARWDNERLTDYQTLDELGDTDFLVIDDVELLPPHGHHTMPADYHTLNVFFGYRLRMGLPTIVICSESFWVSVCQQSTVNVISAQWGKSFVSLLYNRDNIVIELKKVDNA